MNILVNSYCVVEEAKYFHEYTPLRVRLLAASRTLLERVSPSDRLPTALILATTKADIDAEIAWIRQIDSGQSAGDVPTLSQQTQAMARDLGLTGPAWAVSTACSSGVTALIDASFAISDGHIRQALVLGIDCVGSFIRDGFAALKATAPTGCMPFDRQREGLVPTSGAAAILLSAQSPPPATARADRRAIQITGMGVASDAVHMTAPDREARGLIRAMQSALQSAHLQPADIDAIVAHATGTRYNDAMEALAIQTVFGSECPPTTAFKGRLGHTLGASGIVEAALAAGMLESQTIPAIEGLTDPEYPLNFVRQPRNGRINHVMKIASGFGGLNAAIILSKQTSSPGTQIEPPFLTSSPATPSARAAQSPPGPNPLPIITACCGTRRGRCIFRSPAADPGPQDSPDPNAAILLRLIASLLPLIPEYRRPRTGLVLALAHGCLQADIDFDRSRREAHGRFASPAAFSRTLPSTLAAEVSVKLKLVGPILVISGSNPAKLALQRAASWLQNMNLSHILAGAIDDDGNAEISLLSNPPS